ncbi:hypothetical protein NUU61_001371 [Penicillium alfredii]|uniref:Uncharacterized protein n=1 Tax=Penicillium alfredii TaxID=1506179 RepID=A0A9W9G4A4_9EURO|nr:uncharacterized protein NUU61_001371 [Penicillium alfredii]KAJ5111741.1 hypothetical protein NUU61_001371 [Penicillium alfredii]
MWLHGHGRLRAVSPSLDSSRRIGRYHARVRYFRHWLISPRGGFEDTSPERSGNGDTDDDDNGWPKVLGNKELETDPQPWGLCNATPIGRDERRAKSKMPEALP